MTKKEYPWSVPVGVEEIPETGLHKDIEAPAELRAEIAKVADLRDLPVLRAAFDLSRRGNGVRVAGTVEAQVGQTCVVTLEPLENRVQEAVELVFEPHVETAPAVEEKSADEPPEALINGKVDLGVIATEFLILGIDPYPRKPGVEFAAPQNDPGGPHPFAALEALKKPRGGET